MQAIFGTIVHSLSFDTLQIFKGCIVIDEFGQISKICKQIPDEIKDKDKRILSDTQFLIPGFIDTHIHAPQFVFTGSGYDLPLLKWLTTYTFPRESEFSNLDYARDAYGKCVARSLACGTTTASYYATIHCDSSAILARLVLEKGQRAFIGKVNMDMNSPDYYIETTSNSLSETRSFVENILSLKSNLVRPIITPRFAPSCSIELMTGLSDIQKEFSIMAQTHISETKDECDWVKSLFPSSTGYLDVYDKSNLVNKNTIFAHCIYLTEEERALIKNRECGVSHCPNSNFSISSGVLNVRQLIEQGITKVGLGTDISGGYSPSIHDSMRQALTASRVLTIQNKSTPLSYANVIYLATLGGSKVLNLDEKVGNFVVGKEFDGLLIDVGVGKNIELFPHDSLESMIEKWVYNGDDRNILQVFVQGKLV